MKVLFTTQPGVGHLYPMIPMGKALEQAGHEVQVACSKSFVPRVERAGLKAFAAGLDWLEASPEIAFPEVVDMSPQTLEVFLTEVFVDTTANYMTHDLLDFCKEWQPDVIVRDAFEYGGCIVGECLDIPHVAVDMDLYIPNHVAKKGMESQLAYLRSAYGLSPYPAMDMLTRYLYFSYIPPSYQFPDYGLPATAQTLRPAFLEATGNEVLPDWVTNLPEQPTVYATMGTTYNQVPEIFKLIIEGLGGEALNLIITVGHSQDPTQFGTLPDNVHVEQFIPQAALMPLCNLTIANGGVGTTMITLSHGLPILVIPLTGHLLLHAMRVKELGVGQSLKLPAGLYDEDDDDFDLDEDSHVKEQEQALAYDQSLELSPEAVRDTVYNLLTDSSYLNAAQRIQLEIKALPSSARAVELLEQLATDRVPIKFTKLK